MTSFAAIAFLIAFTGCSKNDLYDLIFMIKVLSTSGTDKSKRRKISRRN